MSTKYPSLNRSLSPELFQVQAVAVERSSGWAHRLHSCPVLPWPPPLAQQKHSVPSSWALAQNIKRKVFRGLDVIKQIYFITDSLKKHQHGLPECTAVSSDHECDLGPWP